MHYYVSLYTTKDGTQQEVARIQVDLAHDTLIFPPIQPDWIPITHIRLFASDTSEPLFVRELPPHFLEPYVTLSINQYQEFPQLIPFDVRVSAITDRRTVDVTLALLESDCSLETLEATINDVKARTAHEDFRDVQLSVEIESGYYGDTSANVKIIGTRNETDEEVRIREARERAHAQGDQDREYRQYLALKKKFEG